jgi:hypothetical protein
MAESIRSVTALKVLMLFIGIFHLVIGCGLMFSKDFQQLAVSLYGAHLEWTAQQIYFLRIVGSFAFVLGFMALSAARDPLSSSAIVIGFVEFFVLRNIHRHLYSAELYAGFGVSPTVNNLTTIFFGVQAVLLVALLWNARRRSRETA